MIASRYVEVAVLLVASIVAIYLGSHLVMLPPAGLVIVISVIFVALWALVAGDFWWVPVFALAAVQGTFYLGGIKVHPPQLGVAAAIIGIAPLFMVQKDRLFQNQRAPLPLAFYATAIYVGLRLGFSLLFAEGPRNNLYRLVFDYTWPFFFGFLFYHYGRLGPARAMINILMLLLLIRISFGVVGYVTGIPLYVPGINYVLSFGAEDSLRPMREVAAMLVMVCLIFFHGYRSLLLKTLAIPLLIFSEVMVVLGEGRFAAFLGLLLPIAFFIWSRRWAPVFLAGIAAFGLVAFINVFPQSLDALPHGAGRALSGLVVNSHLSQSLTGDTESSDEWHRALREEGLKRLTASPLNFFFGDGIHASPDFYDEKKFNKDRQEMVTNAGNLGAYESGFFTVLAVLGVVGYGLYLFTFIGLLRQVWPYFTRRPRGTLWEGFVFWGCYIVFIWYMTSYVAGSAPGYELLILLLAVAGVNDGKLDENEAAVPGGSESKPSLAGLPVRYARS